MLFSTSCLALLFFTIFSPTCLTAHNFHNKLVIPIVTIQDPLWEFYGKKIHQRKENSCDKLVTKWNRKIDLLWNELLRKINEETELSLTDIDANLSSKESAETYLAYHKYKYPGEIAGTESHSLSDKNINNSQADLESEVLKFIKLKYKLLQTDKPITVICKDNINYLTTSFGSNILGYYLICNTKFYSSYAIKNLHQQSTRNPAYHFEPNSNINACQCIEKQNLLHLGLIQAISGIVHQSDFFVQLFKIFEFDNKLLSKPSQRACADYVEFRSFLKACLQSKNPLEAAQYLSPQNKKAFDPMYHTLWEEFTQDIKGAYNQNDLDAYEEHAQIVKKDLFECHQL